MDISKRNTDGKACDELLVVLGAGVISYMNYQRAEAATDYNRHAYILATGGKGGVFGSYMPRPEADQLEGYLLSLGAEKEKIYKESKATNTHENFQFSKSLVDRLNPKKVVVVTNKAHMPRALQEAKEIMPEYDITGLPTRPLWYDVPGQLSEVACWVYERTKIPAERALEKISNSVFPTVKKYVYPLIGRAA